MRQLLQIADTPYYILRKLLQIASVLQNAAVQRDRLIVYSVENYLC